MTTFVLKRANDAVQVYDPGQTVVLDDGTKIPYENLASYPAQVLLAFGLYAFADPSPPPGQYLVSVSYEALPEGIDQVPLFADLPPGPVADLAGIAASSSYVASLRRKARYYARAGDTAKSVRLSLKAAGVPT